MLKFTASRLSDGNKVFPDEVIIDDNTVTVKSPKLFGGKATAFPLNQVSVEVKSPFIGFCDITIFANGTHLKVHGFTDNDANRIKKIITEGGIGNRSNSHNEKRYSASSKLNDDPEFFRQMTELTEAKRQQDERKEEEQEQKREKYKREFVEHRPNLKKIIANLVSKRDIGVAEGSNVSEVVEKQKRKLFLIRKILMNAYPDDWKTKYELFISECRQEANKILKQQGWQTDDDDDDANDDLDFSWEDTEDDEKEENDEGEDAADEEEEGDADYDDDNEGEEEDDDANKLVKEKEIRVLIKQYDKLDIDILEDEDEIEANKRIVWLFVQNIFTTKGRKIILKNLEDLKDTEEETEYTEVLMDFLNLVNNIYGSKIVEEEDENGKKVYPYALNHQKIQDFLTDKNNDVADRMSKVIDATDNLIDRLDIHKN